MQADSKMTQKLKAKDRAFAVLAMRANGASIAEICEALNASSCTSWRDIEKLRLALIVTRDRLQSLNEGIEQRISLEQRAERYANLALTAKNEAVSLATLQRIDDLDGFV